MSENEKCETCKFFVSDKCKRYPPAVYAAGTGDLRDGDGSISIEVDSTFPYVTPEDWCGEYKEKQLKIDE